MILLIVSLPAAAEGLPVSALKITGSNGKSHEFKVEVAASAPTRATGLMNRKSLAAGEGMIFIFPQPKDVMMWMKDTLIPLDMLFIDTSGKVINIAENTKPMDETIIPSRGLSAYVLELAGGEARRLHLAAGDKLSGAALAFKAKD
ncbi:DUF192 domain-containing protein [Rhizobium sp. C4]|uniref:DUF192 domain-containing protein n=1 Tax=Rhizobium sp. C4 TaxID=1349800 RepID=UPI001E5DA7B4|nr:DUF192 domain-containing protein [Rhizobium sp. C4]MCD2175984.1 DUF192 domain-containing protein [Rhizobium sp. C4]